MSVQEPEGGAETSADALARAGEWTRTDPARLDEVERRLLEAQAPRRIEHDLAKAWGVTRRHVRRYLATVRKRLAKNAASRDPAVDAEIAREMLLDAYSTAKIGGEHGPNPGAMVQAARVYAEITGALKPARVDITSGGKPIRTMTDDELREEARRLAAEEADAVEPRSTH